MSVEMLTSPDLPSFAKVGIAHAVRQGDMIYTSGQISIDSDGKLVGGGDAAAQTRRIYEIIEGILEVEGGSLDSIVKLLTFYVQESDFDAMAGVRREIFSRGYMPASSAVAVKALAFPGALIEIEAVAFVSQK